MFWKVLGICAAWLVNVALQVVAKLYPAPYDSNLKTNASVSQALITPFGLTSKSCVYILISSELMVVAVGL